MALSGLGGDEAFAGYERYLGFLLNGLYRRIPGFLREGVIANTVKRIPERSDGHYTVNHMKRFVRAGRASPDEAYFSYISRMNPNIRDGFFSDPGRFNGHLDACRDLVLGYFRSDKVEGGPASLNRALYCDVKTYLAEDILAVTDRMSMHHALEVRVPFIDHKLMEFCATIPPKMKMKRMQKKHLLKKAVRDLLPADVIRHRKQGFVGPMTQWLKEDLREYVKTTLSDRNLKRHGLLNAGMVQQVLKEHLAGKEIHDTLIWSILIFQKWYDMYIENVREGTECLQ